MTEISIHDEYITLGQLLKKADVLSTGGQVKWFLQEYRILVNNEEEARRGRKLYPGDIVSIENIGDFKITLGRKSE